MDTQTDLNWIQKELEEINDPMIIQAIKNLIISSKTEVDQKRISIAQYSKELDEALADIKRGNYKTHEEVEAMMTTWGRKSG